MLLAHLICSRWWSQVALILIFWSRTVRVIFSHLDSANYCPDFAFNNIHDAYEAFELSSKHGSLKVIITMPEIFTNGSS